MTSLLPPTPSGKKLLFGVIAVGFAFGILELAAVVLELFVLEPTRSYPLPSPPLKREFANEVKQLQEELGHGISMVADDEKGWKLRPHSVITQHGGVKTRANSFGFRGPELAPRKEGEVRILTLGDSSTFGHLVAEREVFSSVAAEDLSRRWGRPVTGIIGATPGHSALQSLEMLKAQGHHVQPDYVVIGNIWSDIYRPAITDISQKRSKQVVGSLSFLAIYRIGRMLLDPFFPARTIGWIRSPDDVGRDPKGADTRVPLEEYTGALRAMARQAVSLGAKPVFLLLAAPLDFDIVVPPLPIQNYRQAMRKVAREFEALLLDCPELFRTHGAGIAWFIDAVHPSHKGHAIMARGLVDALAPLGPPPARR